MRTTTPKTFRNITERRSSGVFEDFARFCIGMEPDAAVIPKAIDWSPEITVDAVFEEPPVVPFRTLPCRAYRILFAHGGVNDWDDSLVLVLADKNNNQFTAWPPSSVSSVADEISKATFIDFVGFGERDEFGNIPVVIRLA